MLRITVSVSACYITGSRHFKDFNIKVKSCTIDKLRFYVTNMGITDHCSPLYSVATYIGLQGFRTLVIDYIAVPVSGNVRTCNRPCWTPHLL